ncbi:hypothetical protein [Rhodococcus sp. NPDC058514]|uniref:hypothetical protein n=1 Tax=unclassified Rhodococcus (in: high G+C Gram-positive bacteria) TaxID=192944 RepID=UPI00364AB7D1
MENANHELSESSQAYLQWEVARGVFYTGLVDCLTKKGYNVKLFPDKAGFDYYGISPDQESRDRFQSDWDGCAESLGGRTSYA